MRHTGELADSGNPVAPYVDWLAECDKVDQRGVPMVWRCLEVTMAYMDGVWCRLDTWPAVRWTPITFEPTGPFFEVGPMDRCDFSDYRTADMPGLCHHHQG